MKVLEVAVVIVTYKSAELAIQCLASIDSERAAQNLKVRVVVVDNASGDFPLIEQALRSNGWSTWVTLILAPRNGGFAYGNNLGIREAYGGGRPDYVYLLNPDTLVRPGAIGTLAEFLESHPQIGIAGSSFETEQAEDWPFAFRFPTWISEFEHGIQLGFITRWLSRWTVARPMSAIPQATDWISGASMMIRPAVLTAVGCLDETFFLYFEETEFCYRAHRAGYATWYVPQSRVMHMIGKSTNVDENTRFSKRLPGYWFESRRRYYAATRSTGRAAFIDVVTIVASFLGLLKQKAMRRPTTPHYIRDLLAHSVILRRNRYFAPLKTYFPPS